MLVANESDVKLKNGGHKIVILVQHVHFLSSDILSACSRCRTFLLVWKLNYIKVNGMEGLEKVQAKALVHDSNLRTLQQHLLYISSSIMLKQWKSSVTQWKWPRVYQNPSCRREHRAIQIILVQSYMGDAICRWSDQGWGKYRCSCKVEHQRLRCLHVNRCAETVTENGSWGISVWQGVRYERLGEVCPARATCIIMVWLTHDLKQLLWGSLNVRSRS